MVYGLPSKNGDFPWQTVSHNQRVKKTSSNARHGPMDATWNKRRPRLQPRTPRGKARLGSACSAPTWQRQSDRVPNKCDTASKQKKLQADAFFRSLRLVNHPEFRFIGYTAIWECYKNEIYDVPSGNQRWQLKIICEWRFIAGKVISTNEDFPLPRLIAGG